MYSFRNFYYRLHEDQEYDSKIRSDAEKAYNNVVEWVEHLWKDYSEEEIQNFIELKEENVIELKYTEKFLDILYGDLHLMFASGMGNSSFGFIRGTKEPSIIIVTPYLSNIPVSADESIEMIYDSLQRDGVKHEFIHEFVHYLDWKRSGYEGTSVISGGSSDNPVIDMDFYVNNPQEFNAYYQMVAEKMVEKAELYKHESETEKEAMVGSDVEEFIWKSFKSLPKWLEKHLNEKYRKKFRKRLAGLWQEKIKPILWGQNGDI